MAPYPWCIVSPVTGDELRRLRQRLRLTQAELAERVGVSANTVARWERDEVTIRPPMAKLIEIVARTETPKPGRKAGRRTDGEHS
jgi:transcriptional regulator with XRE-family HTH domain